MSVLRYTAMVAKLSSSLSILHRTAIVILSKCKAGHINLLPKPLFSFIVKTQVPTWLATINFQIIIRPSMALTSFPRFYLHFTNWPPWRFSDAQKRLFFESIKYLLYLDFSFHLYLHSQFSCFSQVWIQKSLSF